jgi:hypothetical protein
MAVKSFIVQDPTCLGQLGQNDLNRNHLMCVALPKVAKASRVGQSQHRIVDDFAKNFANVNAALDINNRQVNGVLSPPNFATR